MKQTKVRTPAPLLTLSAGDEDWTAVPRLELMCLPDVEKTAAVIRKAARREV